jgi:[ribosomal protein S18]-alanine N-acetyltransferase
MIIRRVTTQDLPAVMEIEKASFISAVQETQAVFAERIRVCGNCFIIFEDEQSHKTAGYFSAERWTEVPAGCSAFSLNHSAERASAPDGPVIYLSSFALLPQYRGKGTGRSLFSSSMKWFTEHNAGLTKAVLLVNEVWENAAHIYMQDGFHEMYRIPLFFPTGDGTFTGGIVMGKNL